MLDQLIATKVAVAFVGASAFHKKKTEMSHILRPAQKEGEREERTRYRDGIFVMIDSFATEGSHDARVRCTVTTKFEHALWAPRIWILIG